MAGFEMARFHADEALELGIPKLRGGRRELRSLFFEAPFSSLRYSTLWFMKALQLLV
jgi:hypothetical protein